MPSILGQGALGRTYVAERTSDGRQVVVKEIDLGAFFTDEAIAIETELNVLLDGNSDYLVNVYSIFRDSALNYLYLESEYCTGGSLEDLIKQHRKVALLLQSHLSGRSYRRWPMDSATCIDCTSRQKEKCLYVLDLRVCYLPMLEG